MTIPMHPGQALHALCGQQRPRELAQQGKSPIGCKYPSSFPQGGIRCCCVIHCSWQKMFIGRDGPCRRCSWLGMPLARCMPLLRREPLLTSPRSLPPAVLEPLPWGGRANGCRGRKSSVGEGWNLENLGMFSSFGQIAYSLKNSVVGRPAPSVKPCQTW